MDKLIQYADKEGLEPAQEDIETSEKDIKLLVKALIARDLWDMNEYFQIVNRQDVEFTKAVKVLNNWEQYSNEYLKK